MNLLRRAFGALEKRNVLDNPGVPWRHGGRGNIWWTTRDSVRREKA